LVANAALRLPPKSAVVAGETHESSDSNARQGKNQLDGALRSKPEFDGPLLSLTEIDKFANVGATDYPQLIVDSACERN